MKKLDKKKQITQVLLCGKEMLDCYKSYGYPTSGDKYKSFCFDSIKIVLKYKESHCVEGVFEFLINNENNNLPKESSGSLFTALSDKDNFGSGVDWEGDDFTDEDSEFFDNLFDSLFY